MKRMKRNPGRFETLDLYRALARQEGYTFSGPKSSRSFIQRLEREFHSASGNLITIHGIRTQTMFEYVAASLGQCAVIKSEDAGEVGYDTDVSKCQVPIIVFFACCFERPMLEGVRGNTYHTPESRSRGGQPELARVSATISRSIARSRAAALTGV